MKNLIHKLLTFLFLFDCNYSFAADKVHSTALDLDAEFYQIPWGVAFGARWFSPADIPEDNKNSHDVIPLVYFNNEYISINGLQGALHLWHRNKHHINLVSEFRFSEFADRLEVQNRQHPFNFGLQYRYQNSDWQGQINWLMDDKQRQLGYLKLTFQAKQDNWLVEPYFKWQWQSRDYNSQYLGLQQEQVDADGLLSLGVQARYHVISNLYLLGQLNVTRLGHKIATQIQVDSPYQQQAFFGFGFFADDKKVSSASNKDGGQFVRVSHGWATASNLPAIAALETDLLHRRNQFTSFFYGTRLTQTLFNLPIELYLTPGITLHHSTIDQDTSSEYVLAFKAFFQFNLGVNWRFGIAEGLSYVDKFPYIEQAEMDRKGYQGSNLLNYLDFSLGVNLGDVFNYNKLKSLWFGYAIHHRSGIFASSPSFGNIRGGSNYQTLYLQWQF